MTDGPQKVMTFGVGAFTQGMMHLLNAAGAESSAYLTRPYGHFPPSLEGATYSLHDHPSPVPIIKREGIDLVVPMSIEWIHRAWREDFLASGTPFFCPVGEALLIERDREFAHQLCDSAGIAFPRSFLAGSQEEALTILRRENIPFVIKNPLCSPQSPIHTIVCENTADTEQWLRRVNYSEGAFMQEYAGRAEAGHIALVSDGKIYSLVTNQEYKRAFDGDMGIVAGAPLGGISERDENDKYGLARELLHPLLPWFRSCNYHGPIQVTAAFHQGKWKVLEYNVRLGVTNGVLAVGMLENPVEVLLGAAQNKPLQLRWKTEKQFGVSITLAGFGYPYVSIEGPPMLLQVKEPFDTPVWWNEVERNEKGELLASGHRIADINAWSNDLESALSHAYANIRKIKCFGSYYRTDIGRSLWPPGNC